MKMSSAPKKLITRCWVKIIKALDGSVMSCLKTLNPTPDGLMVIYLDDKEVFLDFISKGKLGIVALGKH